MTDILESIFGSRGKTRLIRFFIQNPESEYNIKEIARRNMLSLESTRKELANLKKIKFVIQKMRGGKIFYAFNQDFIFYLELKNLISKSNINPASQSISRVKNIGNVKLAVISGAFINYPKSKADMIIVADGVSRARLKNLMNSLEAEIGKEVDFVLMNGEEFKYRLNMLDKFILEFLEGPHEEIVNKIPGLKHFIANRK